MISTNADFDFTFELTEAGTLRNIYAGTIPAGGDVTIITAGDMHVGGTGFESKAINVTGGDLVLQADGDIQITNADYPGGDGVVINVAGGNINIEADSPDADGGDGTGNLTVASGGVTVSSGGGNITLMGDDFVIASDASIESGSGNINVGTSTATGLTLGSSVLFSDAELDTLASTGTLTISEAVTAGTDGTANTVTSSDLTVDAALSFAATAAGTVMLETDGAIVLNEALSTSGNNLQLNAGTGVSSNASGSITTNSLVAAGGDAGTVNISIGGDIDLFADNDVSFGIAGDVSSNDGDVTVTAHADDNSAGSLTMDDLTLINAGSGEISLNADGDITLGGLLTTNATSSAMTVTSDAGAIIDGGGAYTDVEAENGRLTMTAATGIGTLADALETEVDTLLASTTSGDIVIDEYDGVTLGVSGNVVITANGTIEVDETVSAGGNVTFDASVILDGVVTIDTNAGGGNITFNNGGSVVPGGPLDTLTLIAGEGDITFGGADFGIFEEEGRIGVLSINSGNGFTIISPFDVYAIDVPVFNLSGTVGTVDLGDTLIITNAITITAADIAGGLSAAQANLLATGTIGTAENPLVLDVPPPGSATFDGTGGVITGTFGSITFVGSPNGQTFLINGISVTFSEVALDTSGILDAIVSGPALLDTDVSLSDPGSATLTSTIIVDVFDVNFALGTNLAVAPAAGGDDPQAGEGETDALGDFWGGFGISPGAGGTSEDDEDDEGEEDDLFGDEDVFGDEEEDQALNDE